uniref:Leucine-rich repeat-containing protein 51 n=1 Tax=Mola mola TaxID=94237 RepID=A0A3Q3WMQ5_MOLML
MTTLPFHRCRNPNMYLPPVDLSFKKINSLEDPSNSVRLLRRNSHMKYQSRSLRLCHNNITDLHDLHKPVSHFLAKPSQLAWLDLSFNKISHIDRVLCELRELRVLYLHANSIFILPEVDRLGALPLLHTITLHGNVIETNKAYRWDRPWCHQLTVGYLTLKSGQQKSFLYTIANS